jgi:hypothetical protein
VGAMLSQYVTRKSDQLIVYASRLLNKVEQNNSTTKREVLTMVFALHKFRHYLLDNKFVFYENHMSLVYLINKPQVSRIIARWLLLFLEYDFTIVYKLNKNHLVAGALLRLLNNTKLIGVHDQTIDANCFYTKPKWLNDVNVFLRIRHIKNTLLIQ